MDRAAITPALVSGLIADQFPRWSRLPVVPVELDGWDNTTFRLGDALSVRLPSDDSYVPQVAKEQRWLPSLAPQLPLPIPRPVAQGMPGNGFPRPWSVYGWLEGEPASVDRIADLERFAADLAGFLVALYGVDPTGGPPAGEHSFFRGGPLTTYDAQTRETLSTLEGRIDTVAAEAVWDEALDAPWRGRAVWVHGDVTAANLLVADGELSAVLDFGCAAVGDPACDLAIAWTFFDDESRPAFQRALRPDEGTWARGRGWALWKALITHARLAPGEEDRISRRFGWRVSARGVIDEILAGR